jgi:hypothetical protein
MSETPAGDALAPEVPAAPEQDPVSAPSGAEQTTTETTTDEAKAKSADAEQSAEAKDGDDQDEPEEPKRKRLSGSERLRRENERLRAELASRSPAPAAGEDIARIVEKRIGPPPKEEDFKGDYLAWDGEMNAWRADRRAVTREVQREIAEQQERTNASRREAIADHMDRVADLIKSHPEMREKFNKPLPAIPSDVVKDVLLDSDKSELLLAYLIDHPRAVEELNGLGSERAIARRIGQLEKTVSSPKPKPTQAPPPLRAPTGGARPGFDPATASPEEVAKRLRAKGVLTYS